MVKASFFLGLAIAGAVALAAGCSSSSGDAPEDSTTDLNSVGPPNNLVISQIFTSGGMTGAPYGNGFVEVFNPGPWDVTLDGMSLQYADGKSLFTADHMIPLPKKVLVAGQYFLIQMGAASGVADDAGDAGDAGAPSLDSDFSSDVVLSPTSGAVGLVRSALTDCGGSSPCPPAELAGIDVVRYGADGQDSGLNATMGEKRKADGCAAGWEPVAPAPRNTKSRPAPCQGAPNNNPALVLLNEVEVAPQGGITGSSWGYAEIICTPKASLDGYYFIATDTHGVAVVAVSLGGSIPGKPRVCGAATDSHPYVGLVYVKAAGADTGHKSGESQSVVLASLAAADADGGAPLVQGGNGAIMIVKSSFPILQGTAFDPNGDGTVVLPGGVSIVDGITLVHPTPDIPLPTYVPRPDQPTGGAVAATRLVGNATALSASAWYTGALTGAADSLEYDSAKASANMPKGATLTPGELNFRSAGDPDPGQVGPADAGQHPSTSSSSGGPPSQTKAAAGPSAPGLSSFGSVCSMRPGRMASPGSAAAAMVALAFAAALRRRTSRRRA
jgi:hypothetical protein